MKTCLVTIHGVGFQQDGYADKLQANLSAVMPGQIRPDVVYVSGNWPPNDPGLDKLGTWNNPDHRRITAGEELFTSGSIAHIALVYSNTEGTGDHLLVAMEAAAEAALALGNLKTLQDSAHIGVDFAEAALADARAASGSVWAKTKQLLAHSSAGVPDAQPTSVSAGRGEDTLRALVNDMAMYVVRNSHRERVRSFVHEAILRLCSRDDVEAVVINGHSNGTVIATDVLRQLPPSATGKVAWLVTSGSPLKKYNDFFGWGTEFFLSVTSPPAGQIAGGLVLPFGHWTNFYDGKDPVADPLNHLFKAYDAHNGKEQDVDVQDTEVHNLQYSPAGGLQAHNYWDNREDWIPKMADILRAVIK